MPLSETLGELSLVLPGQKASPSHGNTEMHKKNNHTLTHT